MSSPSALARRAAIEVIGVLRGAGHEAFLAGGCVRDELLGFEPTDFDVATDAVPGRVAELFPRSMEVGASFGVVIVRRAGVSIEVATFRTDGPYSDARRPDSVRFGDARGDAQRRDFTINALFLDPAPGRDPECPLARWSGELDGPHGRIVDFVRGIEDLRRGVVRAVGDPDRRLAEDHLRALRAVRFCARLGFALDPATADAIRRHAAELRGVSRERIGDEMRRMLGDPRRGSAVELLCELGLDAPVLEEPNRREPARIVSELDPEAGFAEALAAWSLDRGHAVAPESWRSALCLSNDERADFTGILRLVGEVERRWASAGVAARKRLAGGRLFPAALRLLGLVDAALAELVGGDVRRMEGSRSGISPEPLLNGDDLVSAGFTPGPAFKRVLEAVYDAQLEERVMTKLEALELARRLGV